MGLKKYEIITVGSDKRVRALRSWAVGDRYVNIGDVGGIVYDEKTLSQDGACWLFRGNFGFPGARIGGDSIVDVAEAALTAAGTPNVDILGSSVVVGSRLQFESDRTTENAVVLTADDFEQGGFNAPIAGNPLTGSDSPIYIRTKNPIFAGGKTVALKCEVPGFVVTAVALDRDGLVIASALATATGVGVTITVPAGQYFSLTMTKDLTGPTVPADATTAKITFTGTYESKLSIIDSRLEVGPANSTATAFIKPGGTYAIISGAKYSEAIIRNSRVSVNVPGATSRAFRMMGQIIGSTATLDATAGSITIAGSYSNVKNLTALGILTTNIGISAPSIIQVTDCNDFAVSPTIFPGLATAQTANVPFIFQGCNVPNGLFYHHAQIANTYKNIDFALAQADLGKATASGGVILVSSEVEGMYRATHRDTGAFGALVESYESVKSLSFLNNNPLSSYGTTIYKDAYLNGLFQLEGTNVFGSKSPSHPLAQVLNVQPRAVQGGFTLTAGQPPVPSTESTRVRTEKYFRLNGAKGIGVQNIPAGVEGRLVYLDGLGNYAGLGDWYTGSVIVPTVSLTSSYAYILFRKTEDAAITPADLAGVTVTVYNGCKIVNTGATAIPMKGNIRVEDNATLVNVDITGTGYFGGNSVMSGAIIGGCVYMKDNASFTKTAGSGSIKDLKMTENAYAVMGDFALNGRIHLSDNARFTPTAAALSEGDLIMKDNAVVSGIVTIGGVLTMKDNAKVSVGAVSTYGDITLCGDYMSTTTKIWTGKRVIDDHNAPEYDNNVKTQYDF